MNRREWVRLMAAGGAAVALPSGLLRAAVADDWMLLAITDTPAATLRRIVSSLGIRRADVRTSMRAIPPAPQDLTMVRAGTVINPATDPSVDNQLRDCAVQLRGATAPGRFIVGVQSARSRDDDRVTFRCDGRIIESLDTRSTYRKIRIPGTQGDTVFALEEGRLTVLTSSCRHELCRKSGPVSTGRIVCAPNRVVASVGKQSAGVDAITG